MVDEEVVVVVVVVADSTGCNGSASRLTRRTRLDLSTYRKHRERGGQETPTFSFLALLHMSLSFSLSSHCSPWRAFSSRDFSRFYRDRRARGGRRERGRSTAQVATDASASDPCSIPSTFSSFRLHS